MTFLRDLASLRSSFESPTRPLTDASLLDVFGGSPTAAGTNVNEDNALNIITVLRGVSLIAGVVAGMPLHVFDRETSKRKPTPDVLTFKHYPVTPFEHWETSIAHRILWGKAVAWKQRNRAGRIVGLQALHPSRVKVEVLTGEDAALVAKPYVLRFTLDGKQHLTSREILHIPGLSIDGITGVSPIQCVREGLGIAKAADLAAGTIFGNGMMLGGVLETDLELQPEHADALKRRWQRQHSGFQNAGDIAVLDRGAKFHQLAMQPADAQFLETRKFQVTEIARWLGLPGWLLNDQEKSTSWGTGMEQQFLAWVKVGLKADLQRIEQRVTKELLNPDTEYAEFSLEGFLRGDSKARSAFYNAGITGGWMVPNEVRKLENLQPVPWGDEPYRPFNQSAGAQAEDDKAPGGAGNDDDE